jgi:hypothetical protein
MIIIYGKDHKVNLLHSIEFYIFFISLSKNIVIILFYFSTGPAIPGFGMMVYHSNVSNSQGALVPAAKSSVYPFGGNTVES